MEMPWAGAYILAEYAPIECIFTEHKDIHSEQPSEPIPVQKIHKSKTFYAYSCANIY